MMIIFFLRLYKRIILITFFVPMYLPTVHSQSILSRVNQTEVVSILFDPNPPDTFWENQLFPDELLSFETLRAKKLAFDHKSLELVTGLIQGKEYNLSLWILRHLDSFPDPESNEDQQFQLREIRQFLLIEVLFHLGKFEKVIDYSRLYFERYANGKSTPKVYYYFAVASLKQGLPIENAFLVTEEFYSQLSDEEGKNLHMILSQNALASKQPLSAFDFLLDSDNKILPEYAAWISQIIQQLDDFEDAKEMESQIMDPYLLNELQLRQVEILIKQQDFQRANELLSRLEEGNQNLQPAIYARLQQLKTFVITSLSTNPGKIGVILPLSYKKYQHLAQEILEGLEIALTSLYSETRPIELVLKDSGGNKPKQVEQAVEELIKEDNVIAILGPITKNNSIIAGQVAAKYKTAVISFSLTENIGKDQDYLFRFQRSKNEEARQLATYAYDYLGARRFVVMYPLTRNAIQKVDTFWETITKKGGKVVSVEQIGRRQTDFQKAFNRIMGLDQSLTKAEKEELEKHREKAQPIADFDAIYIPTIPDTFNRLMAFARTVNAGNVWFLGGNELNHVGNRFLKNSRKIRFADSYSVGQASTQLRNFYEKHWKRYHYQKSYKGPTIYTLYSYEALQILLDLLSHTKNHSREALRNALASLQGTPVLSGKVYTDRNGEIIKEIKILQIFRGKTISVF